MANVQGIIEAMKGVGLDLPEITHVTHAVLVTADISIRLITDED